mgnify:FL=1
MVNTKSKAKAINEFCKWCIYDAEDRGTWREQVQNCNSKECPLFNFRPLTVGAKREDHIYLGDPDGNN